MSINHRKRKHRSGQHHRDSQYSTYKAYGPSSPEHPTFLGHHDAYLNAERDSAHRGDGAEPNPLQVLYIQAYEADVAHGPDSLAAARSLEVVEYKTVISEDGTERAVGTIPKIGSALIRWGGDEIPNSISSTRTANVLDDDEEGNMPTAAPEASQNKRSIWVDRYDARLLLESLPPTTSISVNAPSSPNGWSDLPSDAEDTFFFTPDEAEDFRREKRRRLLDKTREDRLKARMEEDGVEEEPKEEEDVWGGSDEEPDDTQSELMKRTATHLLSSPNPAQLEMRILANHGGDRRFQFLRGRWSRAWRLAKSKAKLEKEHEAEEKKKQEEAQKSGAGLGILAGYGSGDSDSEEEPPPPRAENAHTEVPAKSAEAETSEKAGSKLDMDEEAIKEARRNRLKEWTEKRRAAKAGGNDSKAEE